MLSADGGAGGVAQEKGHTAVVLKAMGRAINKTVTIGAGRLGHRLCGARGRLTFAARGYVQTACAWRGVQRC